MPNILGPHFHEFCGFILHQIPRITCFSVTVPSTICTNYSSLFTPLYLAHARNSLLLVFVLNNLRLLLNKAILKAKETRLESQGISRCTKCYIMCMSPSSLGNCTIYSTWCIMICLVIIVSLTLSVQQIIMVGILRCSD